MLKIKLARFGKRHQPHYRIVINEARDKRDGKYVANIGQYAPTQDPKILDLDMDAYQEWLKKGAQPTQTVARLAEIFASGKGFTKKSRPSKKQKAKEQAAKAETEAPKAEAEAPKAVEKPEVADAESTETAEIAETQK